MWAGHEIETTGQGRTAFLASGGRGGQRGWSSATYVFVESSEERSRWLPTLRKRKQRSQCTKEAKSKRAKENKRYCKGRKHVVESLHKPGINYARLHVRFNRSPSD